MAFAGGTSHKESTCQWRRCLGGGFHPRIGEIPWRKGMATPSSILPWRIPWTEEPGGLQSTGCQESNMTEWRSTSHRMWQSPRWLCTARVDRAYWRHERPAKGKGACAVWPEVSVLSPALLPWLGPKVPDSGSGLLGKGNDHSSAASLGLAPNARADLPSCAESAQAPSIPSTRALLLWGVLSSVGCDDCVPVPLQACMSSGKQPAAQPLECASTCSVHTRVYDRDLENCMFSPTVRKSQHLPKSRVRREPSRVVGLCGRGFISESPVAPSKAETLLCQQRSV